MSKPISSLGGKADSLNRLLETGMPVPQFIVFRSKDLWQTDGTTPISTQLLAQQLDQRLPNVGSHKRFAVRSSANMEDGATHSFAGLFSTMLHVQYHELPQAILDVSASAKTPRVRAYCIQNQLDASKLHVHVVVQEMVHAVASGVAFGADPVSGLLDVTVISAVFGLGESLVDGSLDGDQYLLLKDGSTRSKKITTQAWRLVKNEDESGTIKEVLPEAVGAQQKLTTEQLAQVHQAVLRLNDAHDHPQDVEFAFSDKQFYVVQARPITTLKPDLFVYDNANIVESYPGITLPLTFSFIQKMYASVYRQLSGVLGVRKSRIDSFPTSYEAMLAHLDGRVYYTLNSWYEVLSLLPGYRLNAPAMERMMGVKESLDLPALPQEGIWRARLDIAKGAWGMLRSFLSLNRSRIAFKSMFEQVLSKYKKIDFKELSDSDFRKTYIEFEQTLVSKWRAPLVNDFFAMIFFSLLQGIIKKWKLPRAETLHNELLADSGDIISTQPANRTLSLSAELLNNPKAKAILLASGDSRIVAEDFWAAMNQDVELNYLRSKIEAYINDWGARTIGELKLETRTYEQDPIAYVEVLQAYVRQGLVPKSDNHVATKIRREAESTVNQHLKGWQKRVFYWVLRNTRILVSERENLRYDRTRGFAMVRKMMLELGRRLASKQVLAKAEDVFYISQDRAFGVLSPILGYPSATIQKVVAREKELFISYAKSTPPERIAIRGDLAAALTTLRPSAGQTSTVQTNVDELQGTPCCPGKVRALVRVVHDPTELNNLDGAILVTRSTDPGWITLFPSAAAILVERGSLLSHAAIVSREFGIPCIVGISGLLDTLNSGDLIEMNGATGQIKIITREKN